MGECGCGEMSLRSAHRMPDGENVLGVEVYHGCRYCDTPLMVVLHTFDAEGWREWGSALFGPMGEPIAFDRYGGQEGRGYMIPLLGKADLVRAAREGEELQDVNLEDYANLGDLLSDWGLELLQEALHLREEERP